MRHPELVAADDSDSPDAAAIRALRNKLLTGSWGETLHRALAVVSADERDGRSYVCANLAASLSQLGRRTLLVDADVVRPRQHTLFSVQNDSGLSNWLTSAGQVESTQAAPGFPCLSILPSGPLPHNAVQLVHAPAFAALVQRTTLEYDHVIVDTPAANGSMEAPAIAALARFALVLGGKRESRLTSLKTLLESLLESGVQVTGVVMNEY